MCLSSAVVRTFCGIGLSVVVGVVDFVVVVRCGLSKAGLVGKLVLIEEVDEDLDRLPLVEDAVSLDWVACVVPPSTFFWTPVVEGRLVDGESRWVLTFPLSVGVVTLDGVAHFVGAWVGTLEVTEIRHLIASMKVSMRIEMMTIR